jgi:hypothetical protein
LQESFYSQVRKYVSGCILSPYLAGLTSQEDYSLHAVCRKDTLQGFGLGEDAEGELSG